MGENYIKWHEYYPFIIWWLFVYTGLIYMYGVCNNISVISWHPIKWTILSLQTSLAGNLEFCPLIICWLFVLSWLQNNRKIEKDKHVTFVYIITSYSTYVRHCVSKICNTTSFTYQHPNVWKDVNLGHSFTPKRVVRDESKAIFNREAETQMVASFRERYTPNSEQKTPSSRF